MSTSQTPESLFSARLAADPGSPFVTFYDDATGERAELSAKSLGNWVAKTHFYLLDELDLGVGDRAFVSLPVHWLAAPIAFGCWFAGLTLVDSPAGADVAFGTADILASLDGLPPESLAVSMLSMGRSAEPPAGMADFAASVRPMPDVWATVRAQAGPDNDALLADSRAAFVERCKGRFEPGARVLWTRPWASVADLAEAMVAPLAAGGSLVLVRHPDQSTLDRTIQAERTTVTVG